MAAYSARQNLLVRSLLAIASKVGPWAKNAGSEGVGYVEEAVNAGKPGGFICRNCAFWKPPNRCAIVKGPVQPLGLCRLHVIPQERLVRLNVAGAPRGRIQADTL